MVIFDGPKFFLKKKIFFTDNVLNFYRKQIQDLNWQRKNDQLAAGAKLRELESKYVNENACMFVTV